MPDLDFSDLLTDPTFATLITVKRRKETVSDKGRGTTTEQPFEDVVAIVVSEGGDIITNADERHMPSMIHVHTTFRLRGPAPGYQADVVVFGGSRYLVAKLNDYSQYGAGFVSADCMSSTEVDPPA